jgi:hypothetical protein
VVESAIALLGLLTAYTSCLASMLDCWLRSLDLQPCGNKRTQHGLKYSTTIYVTSAANEQSLGVSKCSVVSKTNDDAERRHFFVREKVT